MQNYNDSNSVPSPEVIEAQSRELERLVRRADHLNTFGTLTSLASTAVYFLERTFGKDVPRWINNVTLAAVGAGIVSVLASFHYKLKAGRIALYSRAHIGANGQFAAPGSTVTSYKPMKEAYSMDSQGEDKSSSKAWVAHMAKDRASPAAAVSHL